MGLGGGGGHAAMASPGGARKGTGTTRLQAAFALVKSNWGIGLLSIPYMLDQAGTGMGIILFVVSICLTQFSVRNLIKTKMALEDTDNERLSQAGTGASGGGGGGGRRGGGGGRGVGSTISVNASHTGVGYDEHVAEASTPLLKVMTRTTTMTSADIYSSSTTRTLDYTAIMSRVLGTPGEVAALMGIWLSSYGSCVAYLKFIADNLTRFFPEAHITSLQWVCIAAAPCLLLSVPNRLGFLSPFNGFGLACGVAFGAMIVYDTAEQVSLKQFVDFWHTQPFVRLENLPFALSIAAFCNEGVVALAPSTQTSMRQPIQFPGVAAWSLGFFCVCYMIIGVAANILFRGHVASDISLAFKGSIPEKVAVVLYCLQLIPTYAIVFFVAYEAAEGAVMARMGIKDRAAYLAGSARARLAVVAYRWVLVAVSGALALLVPKFGAYLALIGALANALLIYVMPHICWIIVCAPRARRSLPFYLTAVFAWLNIAFGLLVAGYGTYQSVEALMSGG